MLRVCGVQKSYGSLHAVKGLSFEVRPGEVYGLLGPNGAGKTTTLGMIVGVIRPDHGYAEVEGGVGIRDARGNPLIGFVPQDVALYPNLSATENVALFGMLAGMPRREATAAAARALATVDLSSRADDRVARLSGGMARRVNIAAGLVHGPKVLALDEPTVGVDPQSRRFILDGVRALADEGLAVVFSSHYIAEVEQLCDRVGIIDRGQMIAEGTVTQLVRESGGAALVRATTEGPCDDLARAAGELPAAERVSVEERNRLALSTPDPTAVVPALFALAAELRVAVTGLEVGGRDLETAFINLTGRSLRE
jgi:ABC-2 type transport system ATP-binding protein